MVKFFPESAYDFYRLGRLKVKLESKQIPCHMIFTQELECKELSFDAEDLMSLLEWIS